MTDSNTILLCAKLSQIAYETPDRAAQQAASLGCISFQFFDSPATGTQAIAVLHGDDFIIAFRGTESWQDIGADLDFSRTPPIPEIEDLQIHTGFHRAADMTEIKALLDSLAEKRDPPRIFLTGHSLGGALAQVTAMLWTLQRPGIAPFDLGVITFGAPMVTDPVGAGWIWPFSLVMFETDGDPVPRLPPATLGYCHLYQRTLIPLPNRGFLRPDHPISGYIAGLQGE